MSMSPCWECGIPISTDSVLYPLCWECHTGMEPIEEHDGDPSD